MHKKQWAWKSDIQLASCTILTMFIALAVAVCDAEQQGSLIVEYTFTNYASGHLMLHERISSGTVSLAASWSSDSEGAQEVCLCELSMKLVGARAQLCCFELG